MSAYEMILQHLGTAVPFATHAGVTLLSLEDGAGAAAMEQTETSINHIGTQHAGALFTLGEAASGAAAAGAFADRILTLRMVAGEARIAYKKIAKGRIIATAQTTRPGADLRAALEADGKTAFDVQVSLADADGQAVAEMTVAWHVKKA